VHKYFCCDYYYFPIIALGCIPSYDDKIFFLILPMKILGGEKMYILYILYLKACIFEFWFHLIIAYAYSLATTIKYTSQFCK